MPLEGGKVVIDMKYCTNKTARQLVVCAVAALCITFPLGSHADKPSCQYGELGESISPDRKWVARQRERECSTFSGIQAVLELSHLDAGKKETELGTVLVFTYGAFDDIFLVRWLDSAHIAVTYSDGVEEIEKKMTAFGNINIEYNLIKTRGQPGYPHFSRE